MIYSMCKKIYHKLPIVAQNAISVHFALQWLRNYLKQNPEEESLVHDMLSFIEENRYSEELVVRYPYIWSKKYHVEV